MRPSRVPVLPTEGLLRAARDEYQDDVADEALHELFAQYPANTKHAHVLLKVVALNRLYSTNILAIYDVSSHIHDNGAEIDAALATGSPNVVDLIADVRLSATGKTRHMYSFASKYCHWHQPAKYPLWDSRVATYLLDLRRFLKGTEAAGLLGHNPDLWTHYEEFVALINGFRDHYGLGTFSYKEIDMFLWKHGAPKSRAAEGAGA